MSRRYTVLPLRYLSIVKFLEAFIGWISRPRYNRLSLREFMSYASNRVLENSLCIILNDVGLTPLQRFRTLEVMLRQDVSHLTVGIFPLCYHERILRIIMEQGTGLRQLNIRYVSVRNNAELLCAILRAAPNLTVLVLPDIAMSRALRFMPIHNLSTNFNLTSENVSSLPSGSIYFRNENLQISNIRDVRRREFSQRNIYGLIGNLIRYLSNLRAVHTYSNCGCSVRFIYNTQSRPSLNLIYLVIAVTMYASRVQLCQELDRISFNFPGRVSILVFRLLNVWISIQLMNILRNIFTINISNSDSNLRMIQENLNLCDPPHAPTMRSIVNSQHNRMYIQMSNPHIFLFLTDIELVNCDISDENVELILTNSPFLRRVLIGCDVSFQDEDIRVLCQRYNFKYLEELRLSSARNLTIISVERLLLFCGMQLTIIGNMNGWHVSSEEIETFHELMRIECIDLTLVNSENDI